MYDGQVDTSADQAYHSQLKRLLLPRLISYLENKISMGHQGGDLYYNFRTYLMFQKIEHMDIPLVVEWREKLQLQNAVYEPWTIQWSSHPEIF